MPDTASSTLTVGPISGFPEYLPEEQAVFDHVIAIIKKHYAMAGALSISTPLVERIDVLTSKGGGAINKEIYGLRRLANSSEGSTDTLGLKFDLTVPLARYVAQHESHLVFPFRRQQIDRVHRGERPQSGRYREFIQADFDIIGRGSLDILTDAEPPAIINEIFSELNIGPFLIRINNRKILNGFFAHVGIDTALQGAALGIIDKAKDGYKKTVAQLSRCLQCDQSTAQAIVEFTSLDVDIVDPLVVLDQFRRNEQLETGIDELVSVVATAQRLGVPTERLKIDLSVARGLDYYTGTVYETALLDHLNLGSICSGGRYDDLASRFSTSNFPGVGISIGVSRLVPRLIEAGILSTKSALSQHVLITRLDDNLRDRYLDIATSLRRVGVPTEIYFEADGLGQQLKYAAKKGLGYAIILGSDEAERDVVSLRNLNTGNQMEVSAEKIVEAMTAIS